MSRAINEPIDAIAAPAEEAAPGVVGDVCTLTKARLTSLVLMTTLVGFLMAAPRMEWLKLLHTLFGTALVACSAAILNQVLESKVDRLMERTRNRPLPSGRLHPARAIAFGAALGIIGTAWLALFTNTLAAALALATLVIYVVIYTPMKRRTPLCISVGAVSGALPPVIGWVAARPSLDAGAWILFGVLFLWQMPHFLSIAWIYRDEYAQAGFVMLRRNDIGGLSTGIESLIFTVALTVVTALPPLVHLAGTTYLVGALVCDFVLFVCASQFLLARNRSSARRLFFASIIYLPLLLGLMVFGKIS
jgi:protoheme IX farnesyltransferase